MEKGLRFLTFCGIMYSLFSVPLAFALSDVWKRDFRTAYDAQFDAGATLDAARNCVRTERPAVAKLTGDYAKIYKRSGELREQLRVARKHYTEYSEALRIYDESPAKPPTDITMQFKWLAGQRLREGAGRKPNGVLATPRVIIEARQNIWSIRGNLDRGRDLHKRLMAARAHLAECERQLPEAEQAFANAYAKYKGFIAGIIPENNKDLAALERRSRAIATLGAECGTKPCTAQQCNAARRRLQALIDAEVELHYMLEKLGQMRSRAIDARGSIQQELYANLDRQEDIARIYDAQQWLMNFGSLMLDVSSVMNTLKNADEFLDPEKHSAANLDDLFEFAKDAESAIDALLAEERQGNGPLAQAHEAISELAGFSGVQIGPEILGLPPTPADLSTIKSDLSDILNLRQGYRELRGKQNADWSDFKSTLGQLIGRTVKNYGEKNLGETLDRLAEVRNVIDSQFVRLQPASEYLLRIAQRQAAAREALEAIESAQTKQLDCLSNGCSETPFEAASLPNYVLRPTSTGAVGPVTLAAGEVLQYLNSRLPDLLTNFDSPAGGAEQAKETAYAAFVGGDTRETIGIMRWAVPANVQWSEYPVHLSPGSTLVLEAKGTIRYTSRTDAPGEGTATAAGVPVYSDGKNDFRPYTPIEGAHVALTGRIGNGEPFIIGHALTYEVPECVYGPLFLGVNDSDAQNNEGSFSVLLQVNPALAEPRPTKSNSSP